SGMGHRELGGDGLPDDDRARRAEISYDVRVVLGDAPRVERTAAFGRRTRRVEDVLHSDRDAHQGAGRRGRFQCRVHEQRGLRVVADEGVNARFGLAVTPDALLDRRAHGGMMRRSGRRLSANALDSPARRKTRSSQSSAKRTRSHLQRRRFGLAYAGRREQERCGVLSTAETRERPVTTTLSRYVNSASVALTPPSAITRLANGGRGRKGRSLERTAPGP